MPKLGDSWDVVEVVRSLVTEIDSLQKITAALEARMQVLEVAAKVQAPKGVKREWVEHSAS